MQRRPEIRDAAGYLLSLLTPELWQAARALMRRPISPFCDAAMN
ncbi:hypothetical protein [Bosea sp. (in: a-proteobacteria)]